DPLVPAVEQMGVRLAVRDAPHLVYRLHHPPFGHLPGPPEGADVDHHLEARRLLIRYTVRSGDNIEGFFDTTGVQRGRDAKPAVVGRSERGTHGRSPQVLVKGHLGNLRQHEVTAVRRLWYAQRRAEARLRIWSGASASASVASIVVLFPAMRGI